MLNIVANAPIPDSHTEEYILLETTMISRAGFSEIAVARYQSVKKWPSGIRQEADHHYFCLLYQDGKMIRRIDDYDHAIRYVSWLFRRQSRGKPLKYVVKEAA